MNFMLKTPSILLASLTLLSADTGSCNCAATSHSRAATVMGQKTLSYQVQGMKCGGCARGLTQKLEQIDGLIKVDKVDHEAQLVQLTVAPEVCETTVQQVITQAGYSAQPSAAPVALLQEVSVAQATALISGEQERVQNLTILDIRTPAEFTQGHIDGAQNLDFKDADFATALAALDRHTPYLLHCKSGGRSAKALQQMRALGFTSVYHLSAGYDGWQGAQ